MLPDGLLSTFDFELSTSFNEPMSRLALALLLCAACQATAPAARLTPAPVEPGASVPSAGCRPGTPRPSDGNRRLTSGGRTRRFVLKLPNEPAGELRNEPAGDPHSERSSEPGAPRRPAPLVLNFHGIVETPQLQQFFSGMDEEAARRGVVMVYPEGVGISWNAGTCCGRAASEQVDDVQFVRDLVRELSSELCLDRTRISATGMSNGGILSYRLACDAADLIAAIAPVAAIEAAEHCAPSRPVPVLAFNGTSDPVVRYSGGWFGDFLSVEETNARWEKRNHCSSERRTVLARGRARCDAAQGCQADVILCSLDGGGHTWPGGIRAPFLGRTNDDVDASATILDFFADHPLRR